MIRPLLLHPANFTPPARTPWGGRKIVGRYKAELPACAAFREQAVGESWELSFGPELPSRTLDGRSLAEVVGLDRQAELGEEAARGGSALLVKWLDAADDLSVQIHPDLDDPALAADETGKPECWYIVEREPGAVIYLGLRPGVDEAAMRVALRAGSDVSQLLERVPVEPGDFFALTPGLPHAVGRGVTLLEPQYVVPGKKGVTLRYWDWNRRYDAQGKLDPKGEARELHEARALAVTRWQDASDPAFLRSMRCSLGAAHVNDVARVELLSGPSDAPVASKYLRAAAIRGNGEVRLPDWKTLRSLTVVTGSITLHGAFGEETVPAGCTAAIAAGLGALGCRASFAHALLSAAVA